VRAGTIACALEGWGESGVRADMAGSGFSLRGGRWRGERERWSEGRR
jgi:hypothetical protein